MRAAIVIAMCAVPSVAAADGYFGVGFGAGHHIEGELARYLETDGEVGGRFVGGARDGNTAVELSFFGTDLHPVGDEAQTGTGSSTLSFGLGVKQFVPLSPNLELYARAGFDRTWLVPYPDHEGGKMPGLDGWGFNYGAGIEVGSSRRAGWGIRAWLDLGRQSATLSSASDDYGVTFTSLTLGGNVTRSY